MKDLSKEGWSEDRFSNMGDEVIFYGGEGGEAERFAVGGKLRDRSYSGV